MWKFLNEPGLPLRGQSCNPGLNMAKKRKYDDEPEYNAEAEPPAEELESSDPPVEDAEQAEGEEKQEGVAPTTGGPQKYRVEQAGGTLRGAALEEGQVVTLTPEEALRQAQSGVQLSWIPEDQVEAHEQAWREAKNQDTDTDRGQVHRPSKP